MAILSPECVYVVRLNLPDGGLEELSGFDSADRAAAVRGCELVLRWLRGGVLYASSLPAGTVKDVFRLPKCLKKRGYDPADVTVEVAEALSGEVVWSDSAPVQDEDGDDDSSPEDTAIWTPAHRRDAGRADVRGPHGSVRAKRAE